jgi:hypothetical protein
MDIDRDKALADVVSKIEEEYAVLEEKKTRLGLNQPVIVAISSTASNSETNIQDWNDQVGYSEFNVKFPFPALNVKSIQLLSANIPQANTNIPNTACVFWYYRLDGYTGQSPNAENLYCVRLLPSYYKQELLNTPQLYGYNQTFKNYSALNTALTLSVANDPAYDNYQTYSGSQIYNIPFLPSEISFNYNGTTNRFSMTGTNATTGFCYRAYSSAVTYALNDAVYSGTDTYKSLVASNLNNPLNNATYWKQVFLPIVQSWNSTTIYNTNALVSFSGQLYQASTRNTNQSPSGTYTFVNGYNYCRFQVVLYGGVKYTFVSATPSNSTPPSADWVASLWTIGQQYPAGFIAEYSGQLYKALVDNVGETPVDGDIWEELGNFWNADAQAITNRYLITGSADPNVSLRQGTAQRQYNIYALYETDTIVYHEGTKYKALRQNQNAPPFSVVGIQAYNSTTQYFVGNRVSFQGNNYIAVTTPPVGANPFLLSPFWSIQAWNSTADNAPIVGLSTISKKFDFYDTELQNTFPVGIPPQPYNPAPKRLLNSVLGFTFSGKFTPSLYSNISAGAIADLVGDNDLNQYNRLRPIPTYYSETALLESHPSYTTQTYTADGFCNLVYSSVLRIFCNLIFAGTLENNLLGIIPFNCGNLGIAFASNYIDNKITKIQDEIYEMNVRLEDEFGEPYVLTNNAVSTLLLKLTYKEKPV